MINLENVLRRVARIAEGLIVMLGDGRNVGHQNIRRDGAGAMPAAETLGSNPCLLHFVVALGGETDRAGKRWLPVTGRASRPPSRCRCRRKGKRPPARGRRLRAGQSQLRISLRNVSRPQAAPNAVVSFRCRGSLNPSGYPVLGTCVVRPKGCNRKCDSGCNGKSRGASGRLLASGMPIAAPLRVGKAGTQRQSHFVCTQAHANHTGAGRTFDCAPECKTCASSAVPE